MILALFFSSFAGTNEAATTEPSGDEETERSVPTKDPIRGYEVIVPRDAVRVACAGPMILIDCYPQINACMGAYEPGTLTAVSAYNGGAAVLYLENDPDIATKMDECCVAMGYESSHGAGSTHWGGWIYNTPWSNPQPAYAESLICVKAAPNRG